MPTDWTIDGPKDSLPAGTLIGVYRVDAPLGEGGMGRVYRATDTKLNRPVAIKLLSDEFADVAARHRFQREAQLASSLNHPHILTVYDAGEYNGRQYLVTEFVDGGTLKDWIKAEKRTVRQIVELLTGIADALAVAHEAKITHRDIKPANILIAKNGYAKLADFGLAKLSETGDPAATRTIAEGHTRPGSVIGTILASAFPAIVVYAQELLPGKVGMISGLFFGLAFGTAGIAAALLGELADHTSIGFVYRVCAFMPLLGLLTVFLPDIEGAMRRHAKTRKA